MIVVPSAPNPAARRARRAIVDAGGLITSAGMAKRYSFSRARAHELTQLDGFPKRVAMIGRSQVYIVSEVDAWRDARR